MRAPKSFEEGMDRLEGILDQMQQPETTLAESVKLYLLNGSLASSRASASVFAAT